MLEDNINIDPKEYGRHGWFNMALDMDREPLDFMDVGNLSS
jgi:hypothetical protein